jgi:acetyltransferase-like isoleucine patch superfamily enzyme
MKIAQTLGSNINFLRRLLSYPWLIEAKLRGVKINSGIHLLGRPIITRAHDSTITIGKQVSLHSALRCNPLGNAHPVIIRTLAPGSELIISDKVGISSAILCAQTKIVIGENTIIGAGAMIIDNDFHSPIGEYEWGPVLSGKPIHIGRGCFIGARAIILKGVTIGDRVIIGAGSVVTKDIPPHCIACGNPARVVSDKAKLDY